MIISDEVFYKELSIGAVRGEGFCAGRMTYGLRNAGCD
jgi:hypothetical protein